MAQWIWPSSPVSITGVATEATLLLVETNTGDTVTELQTLNTTDFATQTTLAALAAEDFATETTLAAATADIALLEAKDFATQTTLAALAAEDFATEATLSTVAGDTTSLDSKIPAQGAALTAASLPVNIASDQTVPVSVASLPLPADAATETTLAALAAEDFATETTLLTRATSAKQDEQTAILKPDVVDQIDTTPLLDTASTNIPGSASNPVEIVSSTAAVVQKVLTVEDIGEFIGLYTGAAAAEVLKCVLPLGGGEVQVDIPAGTRISLRSMTTSAISTGKIAINFIG